MGRNQKKGHGTKWSAKKPPKTNKLFGPFCDALRTDLGLTVCMSAKDGDCLFHSTLTSLSSITDPPQGLQDSVSLRLSTAASMRRSPDLYSPFFTSALDPDNKALTTDNEDVQDKTFEDYLQRISKKGEWGGEFEIVAMSRMLRRGFTVIKIREDYKEGDDLPPYTSHRIDASEEGEEAPGETSKHKSKGGGGGKGSSPAGGKKRADIYLWFEDAGHYNALEYADARREEGDYDASFEYDRRPKGAPLVEKENRKAGRSGKGQFAELVDEEEEEEGGGAEKEADEKETKVERGAKALAAVDSDSDERSQKTACSRNQPCPCGSKKAYKKCCWKSDKRNKLVGAKAGGRSKRDNGDDDDSSSDELVAKAKALSLKKK